MGTPFTQCDETWILRRVSPVPPFLCTFYLYIRISILRGLRNQAAISCNKPQERITTSPKKGLRQAPRTDYDKPPRKDYDKPQERITTSPKSGLRQAPKKGLRQAPRKDYDKPQERIPTNPKKKRKKDGMKRGPLFCVF